MPSISCCSSADNNKPGTHGGRSEVDPVKMETFGGTFATTSVGSLGGRVQLEAKRDHGVLTLSWERPQSALRGNGGTPELPDSGGPVLGKVHSTRYGHQPIKR